MHIVLAFDASLETSLICSVSRERLRAAIHPPAAQLRTPRRARACRGADVVVGTDGGIRSSFLRRNLPALPALPRILPCGVGVALSGLAMLSVTMDLAHFLHIYHIIDVAKVVKELGLC